MSLSNDGCLCQYPAHRHFICIEVRVSLPLGNHLYDEGQPWPGIPFYGDSPAITALLSQPSWLVGRGADVGSHRTQPSHGSAFGVVLSIRCQSLSQSIQPTENDWPHTHWQWTCSLLTRGNLNLSRIPVLMTRHELD